MARYTLVLYSMVLVYTVWHTLWNGKVIEKKKTLPSYCNSSNTTLIPLFGAVTMTPKDHKHTVHTGMYMYMYISLVRYKSAYLLRVCFKGRSCLLHMFFDYSNSTSRKFDMYLPLSSPCLSLSSPVFPSLPLSFPSPSPCSPPQHSSGRQASEKLRRMRWYPEHSSSQLTPQSLWMCGKCEQMKSNIILSQYYSYTCNCTQNSLSC